MLTQQDASIAITRELAKLEQLSDDDCWVVHHELTIERSFGWVIFYGSKLYAETGETRYAVAGNAPFIVNRSTGAIVSTGTSHAVEQYIAEYEATL